MTVQLALPWHTSAKCCHIVRTIVKKVKTYRLDVNPQRERFTRRCVIHQLILQDVRETQRNPLGLLCPKGHVVERFWELYDTLTGRSGVCDEEGFVGQGPLSHYREVTP